MAPLNTGSPAVAGNALSEPPTVSVEHGRYGRLLTVRLKANEDLCMALETVCAGQGIERALLRGVIGSLVDATLERPDGSRESVPGPGVEILNGGGEISRGADGRPHARLQGMVAGVDGSLHAGRFAYGGNLAFITVEASLQEWLPD